MKWLLFPILFLCGCCSQLQKPDRGHKIPSETAAGQMDRDLAYTAWYMHQVGALHTLAFGKYNFNKFQVTPEEIIEMEIHEIQLKYSRGKLDTESREQMKEWLECQKEALAVLVPEKEKIGKINMKQPDGPIRLLQEQKPYLKKITRLLGQTSSQEKKKLSAAGGRAFLPPLTGC